MKPVSPVFPIDVPAGVSRSSAPVQFTAGVIGLSPAQKAARTTVRVLSPRTGLLYVNST